MPPTPTPDEVLPILSGVATFGATLALSTLVQKAAGISTATKVLPSIHGFVTVCLASLASERVAIVTHEYRSNPHKFQKNPHLFYQRLLTPTSSLSSSSSLRAATTTKVQHHHDHQPSTRQQTTTRDDSSFPLLGKVKIPMTHEIRVCVLGLLTFKLLGGRFWAIAPSSYTHLGSFSRWSIPCTERYATSNQRLLIEQMGRKWGCHTCGSRMLLFGGGGPTFPSTTTATARFVGDHMPPKSLATKMNRAWYRRLGIWPNVQFRFYPQCVTCSNTQGSILSKATHQIKTQNSSSSSKGLLSSLLSSSSARNKLTRRDQVSLLKEAGGGSTTAYFHGLRFRINHLTGGVVAGTAVVGASSSNRHDISRGNPQRLEACQQWLERTVQRYIKKLP